MSTRVDLSFDQGSLYTYKVGPLRDESGQPPTVIGAELQVRQTIDSASYFLRLTLGAGITWDQPSATLTVTFHSIATSGVQTYDGVYDLVATFSDGDTRRLCEGAFHLNREVTR